MRAVLLLMLVGCARDPVEAICPQVSEGALVITEIRGPQDDENGPWIELFNASGGSVDLAGTKIRFRKKDGSSEIPVLVRRSLVVTAEDYVVLGLFADIDITADQTPPHVDYGFADDFSGSWLAAAPVDVESCGALIDRATYDTLPDVGTFELGTMPPDADANNLSTSWCFDPQSAGTPGEANTPCP